MLFLDLSDPEGDGIMVLWKAGNCLPFNMVWHPRKLESSRLGLLLYSFPHISFWIALLDKKKMNCKNAVHGTWQYSNQILEHDVYMNKLYNSLI